MNTHVLEDEVFWDSVERLQPGQTLTIQRTETQRTCYLITEEDFERHFVLDDPGHQPRRKGVIDRFLEGLGL